MVKDNVRKSEEAIAPEKFAADLELEVVFAPKEDIVFRSTATNRPGLLFAGFDEFFPEHRIQILGNAEMAYLESLDSEKRTEQLERLFSKGVPCVIVTHKHPVTEDMKHVAECHATPLFVSNESTSAIESDVVHYLTTALAASDTIHGELLDISGIGVLLIGDSGIGKSETALELVHRGPPRAYARRRRPRRGQAHQKQDLRLSSQAHRQSPRGARRRAHRRRGDVRRRRCPQPEAHPPRHLVIEMEQWDDNKSYDRLGNEDLTYDILGVKFQRVVVPVSAGRNLAVVIEAASRNFRLKSMGRDALDELSYRLMEKNRPEDTDFD